MSFSRLAKERLSVFGSVLLFALFFYEVAHAAQPSGQRGAGGIAPASVGSYRNSWAVVIGINRYTKAPRLNYAVNDAKSVVAAVQQLGFPSDKIVAILDRDATKQRIEQVLYGTLRQASPEDRLFVFFAGHGVTAALPRGGEEGYLLPVDGDPDDLPLTAISMEEIARIARRVPAKHILFAVDACYSGFAISRDVPPTKVDTMYLDVVTKEPAVQIITAGRKGEPVLEEEGHGLFTRRLLSGMSGLADTDHNGVITGQELATWLESRVIRDSQSRQHPQYSRLDGEGQFVFVVPRKEEVVAAPNAKEKEPNEELKRLALEAERLRRERAVVEEQRKVQAEREALLVEKGKLEEQRQKAESAKIETLPKVVRVIPENGAENVGPSLKEIVIVFDQPMASGWNINCSPFFFPNGPEGRKCTEGGHPWRDDRTFVIRLPAGLGPGQRYSLTINPWVGLERFKLENSFRGIGQSKPVSPQRFFFTTGP